MGTVKTLRSKMPLEPSKAGLPIFDTKALPIEPNTPVQWDTEERTAKKGVERTALKRESELPVEWMEVGHVEQLYIYPVKSLAPVPVSFFETGPWAAKSGSMVDRQFIVIDRKGKTAPAKKWPHMTLIEPFVRGNLLELNYPGMDALTIKLPEGKAFEAMERVKVAVWGDPCLGVDLGEEVGEWLSDVILGDPEAGMRLLYHPTGDTTRPDKKAESVVAPTRREKDKPYYAHMFPYMMMTQPSISELNRLLDLEDVDLEVDEKRFRPNFLVDGTFPAFDEETWVWVKMGDVVFRYSQVCPRCEFICVDPEMGDKHPNNEPLKTLMKYRFALNPEEKKFYGSNPFLGVNLSVEVPGKVNVGDRVFVSK